MSTQPARSAPSQGAENAVFQRKLHSKAYRGEPHTRGARQGFIVLPRSQINHPLLDTGPYDRRSAWLWLVTSARWARGELNTKGGLVLIQRGQLAVTDTYLANAWDWDRMKVRRFLDAITQANMIRSDRNQAIRVITICNYEQFQRCNAAIEPAVTAARAQGDQNQDYKTPKTQESQKAAPSGRDGLFFDPDVEGNGQDTSSQSTRNQLMALGLPLLMQISGGSERSCRSYLGRLLQVAKDDASHVLRTLYDAQEFQPADWRSWLMAACNKQRQTPKPHPGLVWMDEPVLHEAEGGDGSPFVETTAEPFEPLGCSA